MDSPTGLHKHLQGSSPATGVSGADHDTLNRLFENPVNRHIDWNGVRELFERIGAVKQVSNHRFELNVGSHASIFLKPHTAHLTESSILEVRQFLSSACLLYTSDAADE